MSYLLCLASIAILSVTASDHPTIDDNNCDCFLTDGSSEAYFANHLFFDFRSLSQHASSPPIIDDVNDTASAQVTSDYFASDEWTSQWTLQTWNNTESLGEEGSDATLLLVNSLNNIYVEANDDGDDTSPSASDTYLTLRTARLGAFQSAAEMESASQSYRFLSIRMYARTIGSAGACTAMFTYRDDVAKLADVQEADIEFLTAGPRNRVSYTNQPSFTVEGDDVEGATFTQTLPRGLEMGDWAVHRMDWTPGRTTWFVDGEEVRSSDFQVPRDPSRVLFNAWSNGGSWSGEMEEGGQSSLQIQWIEMVYNTTQPEEVSRRGETSGKQAGLFGKLLRRTDKGQCEVVCSIDEADEVGGAVKLSRAARAGSLYATPFLVKLLVVASALILSYM